MHKKNVQEQELTHPSALYGATQLVEFGSRSPKKIGLTKDRALTVALELFEGDLLGQALVPCARQVGVAMLEAVP